MSLPLAPMKSEFSVATKVPWMILKPGLLVLIEISVVIGT